MAKKSKRLDEFLHARKLSHDAVLERQTQLANLIFRAGVGALVILLFVVLLEPQFIDTAFGAGILLTMVTAIGALAVARLSPRLFPGAASFNRYVLLVVATVILYRLILAASWSPYLVPLPLLAMVAGIAYSQVVGVLTVVGLAFYLAILAPLAASAAKIGFEAPAIGNSSLQFDLPIAVSLALGGIVAVLGVEKVRRQSRPVVVGCYAGFVQAATILCFQLVGKQFPISTSEGRAIAEQAAFAFASGAASGGVLTSLLPAVEVFFGIVSERRLLELADPSNPLLRVLRERAPGTFQHTLHVQQLARNAAEAIGADVLLTEVGAYYHDIGKICKPGYFVENMGEDKTIHDRLRPSMSKMIIVSHVKDGIMLAREEKLPEKIIDMIPMHHGTTVVEFFYRKAKRESLDDEDIPVVEETTYRYPGPRPRFAEAGILMLADTVEAVAKTIREPSSNRFRDMVREIVMKRLEDGQLDECPLTIADLRRIEDSFVRTLTNIHHSRIDYKTGETGVGGGVQDSGMRALPERPEKSEKSETKDRTDASTRTKAEKETPRSEAPRIEESVRR